MIAITKILLTSGKGVLTALLILLGLEFYLHNEDFLHRYRSVFATGRAADKINSILANTGNNS